MAAKLAATGKRGGGGVASDTNSKDMQSLKQSAKSSFLAQDGDGTEWISEYCGVCKRVWHTLGSSAMTDDDAS